MMGNPLIVPQNRAVKTPVPGSVVVFNSRFCPYSLRIIAVGDFFVVAVRDLGRFHPGGAIARTALLKKELPAIFYGANPTVIVLIVFLCRSFHGPKPRR